MSAPTLYQKSDSLAKELTKHLESWGLRRFVDETSYYQWQKNVLAEQEIAELNRLGAARSGGEHPEADISFYDLAAQDRILPVLYSQRYDYYLEIGCAMTDRIEPAQRVLDFGCGVGILTTFYASCFPHVTFMGIDRSPRSIARACEEAGRRGLSNVQFETRHIPTDDLSVSFDLIISTQTLFQAEGDPGLPSLSWKTMERAGDPTLQVQAEIRTGLKDRLDSLSTMLSPGGRMLLCEKAWHLGRRILLQRALDSRRYRLVGQPVFFRYRAIDEVVQDGPLFEVSQEPKHNLW
ncbi:MAG: methyltransferase domain-containing protein, partial [Nitrospirota bacterium]